MLSAAFFTHTIKRQSANIFIDLNKGAVAEAFDAQVISAVENGIAAHGHPQCSAIVVVRYANTRPG